MRSSGTDAFLVLSTMGNYCALVEDYRRMAKNKAHIKLMTTIRELVRYKEKGMRGIIGLPVARDTSEQRCYSFDVDNYGIAYVGLLKC